MKKRLGIVGVILLAGTVWSLEKPNVVLIVCDDLNDYITGIPGETGHSQSLTPNVEKLAASGVAFRRAYSNNPVCAPSRSSFLTGIYCHTSGNLFWSKWYENEVLKHSKTIMEYFRDNGYQVAGTGKLMHHHWTAAWSGGEYKNKADYGPYWFNGEKRWSNPSVPEPFADIGPIDGSFGALGPVPPGQPASAGWKYGWGKEQLLDFSGKDRDLTPDELNAAWAVKKIRQFNCSEKSDPFFLAVGFIRPHTPLHAPQEYYDRFPLDEVRLPVIREGDADDIHYMNLFDPSQKVYNRHVKGRLF
jgi:arylsulfatase A-like enzyme